MFKGLVTPTILKWYLCVHVPAQNLGNARQTTITHTAVGTCRVTLYPDTHFIRLRFIRLRFIRLRFIRSRFIRLRFIRSRFIRSRFYPVTLYPASFYPVTLYPVTLYPVTLYPASFYPVTLYPVTLYPATLCWVKIIECPTNALPYMQKFTLYYRCRKRELLIWNVLPASHMHKCTLYDLCR